MAKGCYPSARRFAPHALSYAVLATSCNLMVGSYDTDRVEAVNSAPLCEIERQAFVFPIDTESTAQQPDLETYYEAANPEFVARLAAVRQDFENGVPSRGVTYLMGAAGVGKSFVVRNAVGAFADAEQCEVSLPDLYAEDASLLPYAVVRAPDLATLDGATVFNELPTHADPTTFDLLGLLDAAGCRPGGTLVPLVVVDGVDEIHDDAATLLLEAIDKLLLAPDASGTFAHFLVAGRPEGFWTWLTAPERTEENNAVLERYDLTPPRYATAGDLDFRLRGYWDFAGELDALVASGDIDAYLTSYLDAVVANPFLTYSSGNLAVGNVVIEQTAPGLDPSEDELKARLFDDILSRNVGTHGRPGDGSALDATYRRLLEEIAVRYAPEVDAEGVFATRSEDTVVATDDTDAALGEVRVRDVLGRGGVAYLVSASTRTHRFRFDPFWLHAHLVERYNARHDPEYTYRTCE